MSFLQLVLLLDKTIKEIILLWRICQFDRYRNTFEIQNGHKFILSQDESQKVQARGRM